MQSRWVFYTVTFAVALSLFVVMLGAYTRLTNAGLGCPDWPGCYGHMVVPKGMSALNKAEIQYPGLPIESRKAWTEMAHRYAAGTLALSLFFVAGSVIWRRLKEAIKKPAENPILSGDKFNAIGIPLPIAVFLILLVLFQAALGMWTVTMKLLPVVVMGHLLGGVLIFATLLRLRVHLSMILPARLPLLRFWVGLGVLIVFCQIALGGWVSANYAGIACIGFPRCNGQWLPPLHFSQGFNLFSAVGANYQGGILDNEVRVTIQVIHRLGAVITALYIFFLSSFILFKYKYHSIRMVAWALLLLVILQFSLGLVNVIYMLPLAIAVAHNGMAALLMGTILVMFYLTKERGLHAN